MKTATMFPCLLVAAVVPAAVSAAPAPRRGPVELTFTLDRKGYLPHEPILADWTLTNVTKRDLYVFDRGTWSLFSFECKAENGHEVNVHRPGVACFFGPPPMIKLQPGQSLRGWMHWNGEYITPAGVGQFTMRPVAHVVYTFTDPDHYEEFKAYSEELSFEIVKPEGADAEIVKRIEVAVLKRNPPRSEDAVRDAKKAAEGQPANEALREWVEYYEYECNLLLDFPSDEAIAKQEKSPRFRAAAAFWCGSRSYNHGRSSPGSPGLNEELLKEAAELLTVCGESEDASPYLKGLAAYHLLLCRLENKSDDAHREAKKMAEALIANYPNTFMSAKAKDVLDGREGKK